MSNEINIKLVAVLNDGTPVNSSNCEDRSNFVNEAGTITVTEYEDKTAIIITTEKGCYDLVKHPTLNAYIGVCGAYKVRVVLRKMIGTITYWN